MKPQTCRFGLLLGVMTLAFASNLNGSTAKLATANVTYAVTSDWKSGFTAEITVENTGDPLRGWTLAFDYQAEITSLWNAVIIKRGLNHYVIGNASWNGNIATGGKFSFGFCGKPGGVPAPTNFVFNGEGGDEPENLPPVAKDDLVTTDKGLAIFIEPLSNDLDPDGDPISIASVGSPSHGSAEVAGDGILYSPKPDFVGVDVFSYQVVDGRGGSATAQVTVNVRDVEPPSGDVQFKVVSDWGSGFTGEITVTNSNDRPTLEWELVFEFPHEIGSCWNAEKISRVGDRYAFKNASWNAVLASGGKTTFGFNGAPGGVTSAPFNVTFRPVFDVAPENHAPIANGDVVSTSFNTSTLVPALANDSDPDGDPLVITAISQAAHGTATINGDQILYQPNDGFSGADQFSYTIQDDEGLSDTAQVSVNVDAPSALVARDDATYTNVETAATIFPLKNDSGQDLSITAISTPEHGVATRSTDTVSYAPNSGFVGTDAFQYTITDTSGAEATATITVTVRDATVHADHLVIGYWHNWDSYSTPLVRLSDVPAAYDVINVAFATPASHDDMTLTFAPAYDKNQFIADLGAVQAQGRRVLISIGGANNPVELNDLDQKHRFVDSLISIIDEYGFDGFDIDFEGSSVILDYGDLDFQNPTTPKIVNLIDAVNETLDYFGDRSLWLTLAPETQYLQGGLANYGGAFGGYLPVVHALRDRITFVHPQLYNTGSQFGVDGGIYEQSTADFVVAMTDALLTGFAVGRDESNRFPALRPDQVAFGLPAAPAAAPAGGFLDETEVGEALDYLMDGVSFGGRYQLNDPAGHPALRGVMTWSINWDQTRDYAFADFYDAYFANRDDESGDDETGDDDDDLNSPPVVTFISPESDAVIEQTSLASVAVRVQATDADGIVASVSITVDGTTHAGDAVDWTPNAYGRHTITAEVVDDQGAAAVAEISVTISNPNNVDDERRQVIGYFTQWDAWKGTAHGFPAQGICNQLNVPYDKYTILNFSFFGVANDGSLHGADYREPNIYLDGVEQEPAPLLHGDVYSSWDYWLLFGELDLLWALNDRAIEAGFVMIDSQTWQNVNTGLTGPMPIPLPKEGGAPGLIKLCRDNGVKLLASIGGWSMCKHFPEMAADPTKKANFLRDCQRLIAIGFDGIDIDWEYPGPFSGMNYTGSEADYHNFTLLMRDIRDAIGPDKTLTAAFSASPDKLRHLEWAELDKVMDHFNLMTYDMDGGWSERAGHNAPLHGASGELCWDETLQCLLNLGVDPNKINMGVPFYGRGVVTNGSASLGAPTLKTQRTVNPDGPVLTAADFTNWAAFEGTPNYDFIIDRTGDWTKHWDATAQVPYMTKGNYFLSYDDERSIRAKADYVVANDVGGVIVWHVFGDWDVDGVAEVHGGKLPEATNVKTPLLDVLDEVFNP